MRRDPEGHCHPKGDHLEDSRAHHKTSLVRDGQGLLKVRQERDRLLGLKIHHKAHHHLEHPAGDRLHQCPHRVNHVIESQRRPVKHRTGGPQFGQQQNHRQNNQFHGLSTIPCNRVCQADQSLLMKKVRDVSPKLSQEVPHNISQALLQVADQTTLLVITQNSFPWTAHKLYENSPSSKVRGMGQSP